MKRISIFCLPSALFTPRSCYGFSKIQIEGIRNSNLRFEADSYYINMYPFYPQVYKKKEKNVYEVSHTSTVLALTFLDKKLVLTLPKLGLPQFMGITQNHFVQIQISWETFERVSRIRARGEDRNIF